MSSNSQLIPQLLHPQASFNWIFLVEYIVIGILALFFLFYFNRVLAAIISYLVRLYTWRTFAVDIDIEAVQISLLAGRIFFKGVRYHGDNETILVHGGYITWQYWLTSVKESELYQKASSPSQETTKTRSRSSDNTESGRRRMHRDPPCRITVKVSGVEAFIYNRSPVYDAIIDNVTAANNPDRDLSTGNSSQEADKRSSNIPNHGPTANSSSSDPSLANEKSFNRVSASTSGNNHSGDSDGRQAAKSPTPPSILRLLPIHVECNKAAAVLGNENTQAIITAKIDSASGEFGAAPSGPLDVFKILMNFHVNKPHIQMRPNVDYKRPQLIEGSILKDSIDTTEATDPSTQHKPLKGHSTSRKGWIFSSLSRKASKSLESIVSLPGGSTKYGRLPDAQPAFAAPGRWLGLTRYLNDDQHDERDEWEGVEYARASTLADINSVDFSFYWDIPGPRQNGANLGSAPKPCSAAEINGEEPPEYGMELIVHGGRVYYGPWADRHRLVLQQIFFPAQYTDAIAAPYVKAGESRLCTIFNLSLVVEADTTLRIPFREPSKDWRWKGRAAAVSGQKKQRKKNDQQEKKAGRRKASKSNGRDRMMQSADARPYAWFDIKIGAGTTINYRMDMFPCTTGYENKLNVDVNSLEMFSSLNQALLWRSGHVAMHANLSYPLEWIALRKWLFDITIKDMELFLLRDHTFLLVDMIEDWTSGPLAEFFTFGGYQYLLKTNFQNFKMYLNVNDANIVNNSDDLSDNDFVILYGRNLDADLKIDLEHFRPAESELTFDVAASDLGFELSVPSKNTLDAFLKNKDLAQLKSVDLKGVYALRSEVKAGTTETLNMNIIGRGLEIAFYGFFARQLAKIKENYFGEDIHFRTLEEYQDLVARNANMSEVFQTSTRSNDLDVILDIVAEDVHVLLPAGIYSCEQHVELVVDSADVDLRVNNYYLELMVDSSPLFLQHRYWKAEPRVLETSPPQLFLDGVHVYGHRLFGLPPSEPAYVSTWDIDAGDITGELSSEFISTLAAAGQALALTMTDEENALPIPHLDLIHDSTVVKFKSSLIRTWLRVADEAFLIDIEGVQGHFDDMATQTFSTKLRLDAPKIVLACMDTRLAQEHLRTEASLAEALAYMKTSVSVDMVQRSQNFEDNRKLQQAHLEKHDRRSHRAPFLIDASSSNEPMTEAVSLDNNPVSLSLPTLPTPLTTSALDRPGLDQHRSGGPGVRMSPVGQEPPNKANALTVNDDGGHAPSSPGEPRWGARVGSQNIFQKPRRYLEDVEMDLKDVPQIPESTVPNTRPNTGQKLEFSDSEADKETTQTMLIIRVQPGLSLMCKPRAVIAAAAIVQSVLPKDVEGIFDKYQMDVIGQVIASLMRKRGKGSVVDIRLQVPWLHARFINPITGQRAHDQYDLVCRDNTTSLRIKTLPEHNHRDDLKAAHITVASIELSVRQQTRGSATDAVAASIELDEVLLWLADSDRTVVQANYNGLKATFASREVKYLAALVHRTTLLADQLQAPFSTMAVDSKCRSAFLVYQLTKLGEVLSDPSFLTRPSYVLRSAKDHLRNSDSWKILLKLRWVLRCLKDSDREQLLQDCLNGNLEVPEDAESYVLATLDHWRSWDAIHVKESVAMRILYGSKAGVESLNDRSNIPVSVVIRGSGFRFLVDPGGEQNELLIDGLTAALSITPPPPPSAMNLFMDYEEKKTTAVQLRTAQMALNLNWNVCELVDQALTLFEGSAPSQQLLSPLSPSISRKDWSQEDPRDEVVHVVFSTDMATVNLQTLNVLQRLSTYSLKVSAAVTTARGDASRVLVNVATTARDASMTTHHGNRVLLKTHVRKPTMFVSYEKSEAKSNPAETLKLVGDSEELQIDIREEILGILETVNAVVRDEVPYIVHLAERHRPEQGINEAFPPLVPADTKSASQITVSVTLLLQAYTFRLAILPELHYATRGHTIRLAITPEGTKGKSYQADFDLKKQYHYLRSGSFENPTAISELEMPPINGYVRTLIAPQLITASAMLTVEQVEFDGAELYGILSTLGSPAVVTAIESIKSDAISVGETIKRLTPPGGDKLPSVPSQTPSKSRSLIFDAGFVLEGFKVSAKVPATVKTALSSEVAFTLGYTQVRAANRSSKSDVPLPFPEISIMLGQMELILQQPNKNGMVQCGSARFSARFNCLVEPQAEGYFRRKFAIAAFGPQVEVYCQTAPALVHMVAHFQQRFRTLDLSQEKRVLRRLRHPERSTSSPSQPEVQNTSNPEQVRFISEFALDLQGTQMTYVVEDSDQSDRNGTAHDLVLTLKNINLLTRSEREARLKIDAVQLQLVPPGQSKDQRSRTSALMPEMVFNVSHDSSDADRRLVLQAAGKALDLQIDPYFVGPASKLEKSLSKTSNDTRLAVNSLAPVPVSSGPPRKISLGKKRLSSLVIRTSFAGAVIRLQGRAKEDSRRGLPALDKGRVPQHGRYGQFSEDGAGTTATLRAPGILLRVQYIDTSRADPSLNVEVRVDGSDNVLTPSVVPLLLQVSHAVEEAMSTAERAKKANAIKAQQDSTEVTQSTESAQQPTTASEENFIQADPRAILGKTRLNIGVRICKQQFAMSCQPIAKVAASARLDDIYVTFSTVDSNENGNFFALSAKISGLQASLQHVYSREATFVFDIDSIVISLMNSKHLSGSTGVSAILKINPMKAQMNAKQLQDVLLFREIWLPPEIRNSRRAAPQSTDSQEYFVQRYQQIAASTAFPWNATVVFADLKVELDLGQAIGKITSRMTNLWASSKKSTSSKQTLYVGVDNINIESAGRLSGLVELQHVKVRTAISWPASDKAERATPLVQGSVGFQELRSKIAFDYQTFAVAHITSFEFIMYNVRDARQATGDRLVAILDGDKVHVYCVAASAALGVSLVQAFERLIQEKKTSYEQSLKDIESFLRRKSSVSNQPAPANKTPTKAPAAREKVTDSPISLHTDVVATIGSVDVGAFPRTVVDNQILKLEAIDVQARFAVALADKTIQSGLGLTLGQVRAALSNVPQQAVPKTLGDITIEEVDRNASSARGGVILRVPRVVASMQTWQEIGSKMIDYKFKSTFEGKIDVGWNYSRISFIRGMWATHSRTLASRLGKPLPESALKITGPQPLPERHGDEEQASGQSMKPPPPEEQKITAVVNLPQSKYTYRALEPPIIDTPQLRDMGEATPPLEWIGLHRDKLPNVTHQIVIVSLLEVAKEVEDAYSKILGSAWKEE